MTSFCNAKLQSSSVEKRSPPRLDLAIESPTYDGGSHPTAFWRNLNESAYKNKGRREEVIKQTQNFEKTRRTVIENETLKSEMSF